MKLSQPQVLVTKKNKKNLARLSEMMEDAKVKQYLLDRPDFLTKNPELLSHIELNYEQQDTFSLVERQVKTLREKNSHLQGQQIEMLQMAHANEELLNLCNQFMLDLLSCKNLNVLTANIINSLKKLFDLDAATLILVGYFENYAPAKTVENSQQLKDLLHCQFPDNQPLCGRLSQASKLALFGELSDEYQSCALIPLGKGCEKGLIALASNDPARFDPEMGTLFIELIAKYVCALITPYEQF